ncbi:short-chain dehydrogenase [Crocosphaera sp.]|uniref:short-chain dehydrogenase n=1 Tax=Crocosphaera sp. TaxID=2729996 RepID=UPI003F263888
MCKKEDPSLFNTLEAYEDFVNHLLAKEKDLKVDPILDWEDIMEEDHILTICADF